MKKDSKILTDPIKQKEESDNLLLKLEWIIGTLALFALIVPIITWGSLNMPIWQKMLILIGGVVVAVIGLAFAVEIEQKAGYYECRNCNHRYIPTYKAVIMAPHMGRTRYIKCPECGKKTWQKKVLKCFR